MQIKFAPMGYTQTNCYIISKEGKQLIIDPGMGATDWVLANVSEPLAILNTHGHYDHVWSNAELKEKLHIPIYIHEADAFMLQKCPLGQPTPPSHADVTFAKDKAFELGPFRFRFRHFPGHTPGCSIVEIDDVWFSGDFLFQGSIGRWDFPYSDGKAMIQSLRKAMQIKENFTLYPGHGMSTTLKEEQRGMAQWIAYIERN